MIISASRRTDIPAFYSEWFMQRVRAGYCSVPNPFNVHQVVRVSLTPNDVDVIVFWTRNPIPLFPYLEELDRCGFRYYFQFTLLGYPRLLEPNAPPRDSAIAAFSQLADQIGPERVVWRYDPIIFSAITPAEYHIESYRSIARELRGCTYRSVVSFLDIYAKAKGRLRSMEAQGARLLPFDGSQEWVGEFVREIVSIAGVNDMEVFSCAEEQPLAQYGLQPGRCIDSEFIFEVFGLNVGATKDPGQRKLCGCVISKDIGAYDSCAFGCQYCYAVSSFERARENYSAHDPHSPSLLGWYEAKSPGQ